MGDHHPLGIGGRARGVLEEGERLRAVIGFPPVFLPSRLFSGQPLRAGELGDRKSGRRDAGGPRGEDQARRGVAGDGAQAGKGARGARRIGRHGDRAGVEAAEEGDHEVEAGRQEEKNALPLPAVSLQERRHGARPAVERAVGQALGLHLAVGQEGERPPAGVQVGLAVEGRDQARLGAAKRRRIGHRREVSPAEALPETDWGTAADTHPWRCPGGG